MKSTKASTKKYYQFIEIIFLTLKVYSLDFGPMRILPKLQTNFGTKHVTKSDVNQIDSVKKNKRQI